MYRLASHSFTDNTMYIHTALERERERERERARERERERERETSQIYVPVNG